MFSGLKNVFWRNFRRSRAYGFSLLGHKITHMAALVSDVWPGSMRFGESLLMGDFPLGDRLFSANDFLITLEKPQTVYPPMASYMQSFMFLYDLSTISGNAGRKRARQLIEHWIRYNHSWAYMSWNMVAWKPGVVGLRLSAWLSLYDFYASTADDDFKRLLMTSFDKQLRYLKRHWREESDPIEQFWALKGVIMGELLCADRRGHEERLRALIQSLLALVQAQLLPDGGHVSRIPMLHWRFLRDLIDIRNALPTDPKEKVTPMEALSLPSKVTSKSYGVIDREALQSYIQKMTPLLRLLRHGDGKLAYFEGELSSLARGLCLEVTAEAIDSVLTQTDAEITRPPQRAPDSGYERCASRNSIFLVNTHPRHVAYDEEVENSPYREPGLDILNIEWSVGRHRVIHVGDVVMQLHNNSNTIAHNDMSWMTCLNPDETQLLIKRHSKEGHSYIAFDCTYVGKPTSLYWQRQIYMAPKGEELRGHDTFRVPHDCTIAIRFIVNPQFMMTGEGDKIYLTLKSKAALNTQSKTTRRKIIDPHEWRFRSMGSDDVLKSSEEEGDQTLLLIKECEANRSYTFKWSFSQTSAIEDE